jgi:hypothetical protein
MRLSKCDVCGVWARGHECVVVSKGKAFPTLEERLREDDEEARVRGEVVCRGKTGIPVEEPMEIEGVIEEETGGAEPTEERSLRGATEERSDDRGAERRGSDEGGGIVKKMCTVLKELGLAYLMMKRIDFEWRWEQELVDWGEEDGMTIKALGLSDEWERRLYW